MIIVDKSTVPVGTADKVKDLIQQELSRRKVKIPFDVVSNPEFLKEGAAIEDFMRLDRVVVGADNPKALEKIKELFAPFTRSHERFIAMDVRSAEMTKYAANAMGIAKNYYLKNYKNIEYTDSKYTALTDADTLIFITEWKEFRSPDFDEMAKRLKNKIIFDGRNQYNKGKLNELGFEYYQIGGGN